MFYSVSTVSTDLLQSDILLGHHIILLLHLVGEAEARKCLGLIGFRGGHEAVRFLGQGGKELKGEQTVLL
jgi:hypothetical protein